jgi:hypothetical protein
MIHVRSDSSGASHLALSSKTSNDKFNQIQMKTAAVKSGAFW